MSILYSAILRTVTSSDTVLMRHCVSLCFIVLLCFYNNIVSGQLALLLLIND